MVVASTRVNPWYSFDEFRRRRNLLAEYAVHRVLAMHGPGEQCAECGRIVAALNRKDSK